MRAKQPKTTLRGWAEGPNACSRACVSSFLFLSTDSVAGRFLN
jgi:hypothetical protein